MGCKVLRLGLLTPKLKAEEKKKDSLDSSQRW